MMHPLTIMIVDDDEALRETYREACEDEGYRVVTAANGKEALELFAVEPTDVVITDILMPEKEGIETIFELKRRYKAKNIIAMSGGGRTGNMDILRAAKGLGVTRIFTKPIDLDELFDCLRDMLRET